MAVRQDDTRSWSPSATVPEATDAAAVLADLSAHRPSRPAGTTAGEDATTSAPVDLRPSPYRASTRASAPGASPGGPPDLTGRKDRPGFSDDGRWWWDGRRWTSTDALERTAPAAHDHGRRRSPALVWAGVVTGLLVLLGLAAAPVLWGGGASGSDEMLQTALLEVAEAQQQHLIDHGTFAPDEAALAVYVLRLGGLPDDVTVEVLASDELSFCVAGSAPDGARLWVSESGAVTNAACA